MSATLTCRNDLHPTTRDAIAVALRCGVVDGVEVAIIASRAGADDALWLATLCELAFEVRHTARGRDARAALALLNDAYHGHMGRDEE